MARLLLVEDELNFAGPLKSELEQQGHTVRIVGDGEAAIESAQRDKFDLIILDLKLPKKGGYEVCRELRRKGNHDLILMLTGTSDSEAEIVLGLNIGADDYVVKGYHHELLARITALLRRTAADKRECYTFGSIAVDFNRGEVRRNGNLVGVTKLEFEILKTFLRNSGRILTRGQLLDHVWRDSHPTDRVIDTHIVNLRKKIEDDPEKPRYIVSVRGYGYRFEADDLNDNRNQDLTKS